MSGKHISPQVVRDVLEMGNGSRHDISDYTGEKEREGSWRIGELKRNGEAV